MQDHTGREPKQAGGHSQSRLVVLAGAQMTTFRMPADGEVTIGRAPGCCVHVDHPSLGERHATLTLTLAPGNGPRMTLTDLASGSPTTVGSTQLGAGQAVAVSHGVILQLGTIQMSLQTSGMSIAIEQLGPRCSSIVPQEALDQRQLVERIAASSIGVLILGETGVGKEVMANAIHAASPRRSKPLLCLNCAAFTEQLLESELLGYERGAFTGAVQAKAGLLENADGGTVFLDEVGDMPLSVQAKLLRVIEQKRVTRLGGLSSKSIDVRFLAATNRDLEADITRGTFRRDMYFRLNGISMVIPPLRDRIAEIGPLATVFLEQACKEMGRTDVPRLSLSALASLERHEWPGNIRELRNTIERALVLSSGATIEPAQLRLDSQAPASRRQPETSPSSTPASGDRQHHETSPSSKPVSADERARIIQALEACAGNQTKAAQLLGCSRGTLVSRIAQYGLPRPKKGSEI